MSPPNNAPKPSFGKIDHGTVRGAADGSGGGAMSTGSGHGTVDSPHMHTTTPVDKSGNTPEGSHTTVTVDGKSITL